MLRQPCFDMWHSRPRLCELPYTAEGGCATSDRYFMHQTMLDGALGWRVGCVKRTAAGGL